MLETMLKQGEVTVTFTKKSGEVREMLCTLKEDLLPATKGTSTVGPPSDIIVVYDLEANGWRSFRKDSVIEYS